MEENPSFLRRCLAIFTGYIRCSLLDAVIIAAANAVFLYIMKMPHIVLIAVLAGVTNLIPSVGPVIGTILGGILLLIHDPLCALWFLLFSAVLQLLDGWLIRPKLFGSSLGLPALAVFLVTLAGSFFFGVAGLLFAVPAAAVVMMAVKGRRGEPEESPAESGSPREE